MFLAALLLAGPRASPCAVQAQQMQQPVPFQFEIPGDLQLIDQRQLGIFHYPLSGFVSVTADTNVSIPIKMRKKAYAGTFHFFLRGVPHVVDNEYQGLNISGFVVFMDAATAHLWNDIKHEQPSLFNHYMPRVFVRDPWGNELDVTVTRAHEGKRPAHLSLYLPATWAEATLMVGRFRRTFSLNNLIETAKKSRVRRGRQVQVYSVIGQFHSLDKGTAARMVRMHVDWHRLMGVRASYVYVTTDFVKYMDDVTLEPYMRYDFLLPVLWDVFPRIDTVHHYDQVIVYTHALLSLWQRNAYAFLSDVDELLVTPEPVNIVTLINKGCLRGIHQVLVDSYGTYCESCLPATPTPDTPQDDSTTELHVWQQETLLPLTKYTLRSDKIIGQPKIFGHADYVSHVFVHGGVIQPELQGHTERMGANRSCVWIAHLRNLFGMREVDRDFMVKDVAWQWPLEDLVNAADESGLHDDETRGGQRGGGQRGEREQDDEEEQGEEQEEEQATSRSSKAKQVSATRKPSSNVKKSVGAKKRVGAKKGVGRKSTKKQQQGGDDGDDE